MACHGGRAQAWFLPDAKVCHKRRTSIRLFFKQVFVFGTARVNLDIRHPESRRALFMLPSLFTIGSAALLLAALCTSPWFLLAVVGVAALWALGTPVQWGGLLLVLFGAVYAPWWFSLPFGALMLLWFADASVRNRSVAIGGSLYGHRSYNFTATEQAISTDFGCGVSFGRTSLIPIG